MPFAPIPTAEGLQPRYDFIVPLPYTSTLVRGAEGGIEPRLSVLSRMAIDAASLAWQANPKAHLLVTGETAYGQDLPSTADLMALRAEFHGGVAPEAIITHTALPSGRKLNNTYLQMRAIATTLGENKGNVLFVPLDFHVPRTARIAQAFGFTTAAFAPAEAILRTANEHRYDVYAPYIPLLATAERWLHPLTAMDRKGRLLNALTAVLGGRQMDITVANGHIVIENGSASQRLQRLQQEIADEYRLEPAVTADSLAPAVAQA
jgi:hypothetical protein